MTRVRVSGAGSLKGVEDSGFHSQHILMHRKVLIREGYWKTVKSNIFKEGLMIWEESHNVLLILTKRIHN